MRNFEGLLEIGGAKKDIACLIVSGVFLLFSLFDVSLLPFNAAWIAIVLCGLPIAVHAIVGLLTEFDIKADVLVFLALVASVFIGEDFAAGEIAFIMQLGSFLEESTVAKARRGIEKLVSLTPQMARVLDDGKETMIPAEKVRVDDRLKVLPGETIPVDGVIESGETSVNCAVMTGESMPVDKVVGDEVLSGTVNLLGAFVMRATKLGEDSSIQKMIRLVRSADAKKAKIVGIADRFATWIVLIALSTAVLTWIFSGEITRAVTILVVFCPCALVLATPTAIVAAIGNATRHGFLVREGDALERLAKVSMIAFDKTGTLTIGKPRVVDFKSSGEMSDQEIFALCAAAESFSEHPIGKAIVTSFREKFGKEESCENFQMLPGHGISAMVRGKKILAGNARLLEKENVQIPETFAAEIEARAKSGAVCVLVAADGRLVGSVVLSDLLRADSRKMVAQLKELNLQTVLLTGDGAGAAERIADEVGVGEVHANCLPEDKLNFVAAKAQAGENVCMIGDGINDAPALKTARVGIAMGTVGSDIAIEAADMALIGDEVKELPHLFALSRRMMTTIRLNMTFSLVLNFVAIVLAIIGILNPVVGALVHNAGSILVVTNSALLLKWKRDEFV